MRTISKREEKIIASLKQKKFRNQHSLFVAEGEKLVQEALDSTYKVESIVVSKEISFSNDHDVEYLRCDERIMKRLSSLNSPPGVMAVISMKVDNELLDSKITLMLDSIQDPGNLGTIIRSAEGLGVGRIICSEDTVDCFNPKVVQASMGSIFRVNIVYGDLQFYLSTNEATVYAADMKGENVYHSSLKLPAVLIMGSEAHGLKKSLLEKVNSTLAIPMSGEVESFNVAVATTIILSEFRRQFFLQLPD